MSAAERLYLAGVAPSRHLNRAEKAEVANDKTSQWQAAKDVNTLRLHRQALLQKRADAKTITITLPNGRIDHYRMQEARKASIAEMIKEIAVWNSKVSHDLKIEE